MDNLNKEIEELNFKLDLLLEQLSVVLNTIKNPKKKKV
jgi:hypothetical protein